MTWPGIKPESLAQAVSHRFQLRQSGFEPRLGHVGFVVDYMALVQVFSDTSVSPAYSYYTKCSTLTYQHQPGLVQ
jgi:hypothetical protein